LKGTLDAMSFVGGWGFNDVLKPGVRYPPWPQKEKDIQKRDKAIRKSAYQFYRKLSSKKMKKPDFMKLYGFYMMKTISANERVARYFPADHDYYKNNGWHGKGATFYYRTRVNPFSRLIVSAIASMAGLGINSAIGEAGKSPRE
jgi:hypothetical protein